MIEMIRSEEIGQIHHIYGTFTCSVGDINPESRLFAPALSGGALLDIGVYPLMAGTAILGWNPVKLQGMHVLTETGVDARMSVQMQYADGATAQFMTALDAEGASDLLIYGAKGQIRMNDFWHASSFDIVSEGRRRRVEFEKENEGFYQEFEEAARCIRAGLTESPLMTHEESVAVSRMTEQLRHEAGVFYPEER